MKKKKEKEYIGISAGAICDVICAAPALCVPSVGGAGEK
jgi:peptidase E